jgi:urease accessory protein
MLELDRRASRDAKAAATLTLPWERRGVTRQRVQLDDGREAGVFLPRGEILRGGDRLSTASGEVVAIVAAIEPVMVVRAAEPRTLARAAYHLGNRHVAVEVGEGWLKLERDHVLGEMLQGLGVRVEDAMLPFEPEAGAYAHGAAQGPSDTLASRMAGHSHA